MTEKQPMQADGDQEKAGDDGTGPKPGAGESGGGPYPNPHKGGGGSFDGGQSDKSYEGPPNPNATTD